MIIRSEIKKSNQNGFTLVEIIFVVVLVSILSISILSVITRLEGTKRSAEDRREIVESVTYITSLFRSMIYSKSGTPLQQGNNNSQAISPGSQRSIIVEKSNKGPGELVRFSTFLPTNFLAEVPQLSGEVEARFYVNNSKELIFEAWEIIQAGTGSNQGSNTQSNDPRAIISLAVAKGLDSLQFRYWANNKWGSDWSNPYNNNPQLIEVSFHIISSDNTKNVIRIAVPYSRN